MGRRSRCSPTYLASDSSDAVALAREKWTTDLFSRFASRRVNYQTHDADTGVTTMCDSSFQRFVETVFDSSHALSHILLDEDLLSDLPKTFSTEEYTEDSTEDLATKLLRKDEESFLEPLSLPRELWPYDWFDLFPASIRPKTPCLVVGGAGARSRLHADPLSWTGWNYLVEGSKLWTFFAPDDEVEDILNARRLETDSRGDGGYNISAGWDSDIDLYAHRGLGPGGSFDWPSASALGVMPAVARQQALEHIRNAAARAHPFVPGQSGETSSSSLEALVGGNATSGRGAAAADVPAKVGKNGGGGGGGGGGVEGGVRGGDVGNGGVRRRITVLQTEGQLLLIPPRWWHQTYHIEPSVAIAGQYLNANNEEDVYNHILEWSEASVAAKDLKVEGGAKRAKQRAAKGSSECAPSFVTASATERATEHATEHATESAAERATWSAQYWYGGGADRRDAEAAEVSDSPMDAQIERLARTVDQLWTRRDHADRAALDRIHTVLKAALYNRHGPIIGDRL
mmetsp:Transcript_71938/g.203912  ORF Transcript_71938/g.203912 Transcript_71938/m.203912 type:complete len:514 (+) Transcript_71938:408-1949(+)